jgi:hypothetical protein
MSVVHRERVAWEGARIFVAAAEADAYWWLSDVVGRYLGTMYELKLAETRLRLQSDGGSFAEAGAWRARLEELLQDRPDLIPLVLQVITETAHRLPR